jgi:hypothetical protein
MECEWSDPNGVVITTRMATDPNGDRMANPNGEGREHNFVRHNKKSLFLSAKEKNFAIVSHCVRLFRWLVVQPASFLLFFFFYLILESPEISSFAGGCNAEE